MCVSSSHDPPKVFNKDDVPSVPIWRLTVDQYHEMARVGILLSGDPVELLEGWLVCRFAKSPQHATATRLLRQMLQSMLPDGYEIGTHDPVTLADSEPEPDVSVVRGATRVFSNRHPGPHEVALVVEIADVSLDSDRGLRQRIYARAGILVYWIVNLPQRRIEVHSEPGIMAKGPGYGSRQVYGEADSVPVVLEGREIGRIAVRDVLP